MTKQAAQTRAFLDAVNDYGRNYNLPVTFEDAGSAIVAHYPPKEAGMLSGGGWTNGRPARFVSYPYTP